MTDLKEMIDPLTAWYRANKRDLPWRREVTPYRVWISEIMLQQTRVEAVKDYFLRFTQALPDAKALAEIPEQQLLKLWEGLGYYSRARNLQKAAKEIVTEYGGQLPASYEKLIGLPGIGPYTAGAVASIAFGIPVPAVDGNVLRVVSRLTADDADIADPRTKKAMEERLAAIIPASCPGDFNQAIMELGATVCVPNGPPDCARCPLSSGCEAFRRGIQTTLPVKAAAKPRKIQPRTILALVRDGRIAIRRRPARGLLAGLWELPGVDETLDQSGVIAKAREWGFEPLRAEQLPDAKHIFTHIEWRMTGWRITVAEDCESAGLVWVDPERLTEDYPLPSAFSAYLQPFLEKYGG